ncbi:MAG: aldehyde dehydrogenase family protein [Anaerolineae bacterium]
METRQPESRSTEEEIGAIVRRVLDQLGHTTAPAADRRSPDPAGLGDGLFDDIESAVAAAAEAFHRLEAMPLAVRAEIIAAMRKAARENARHLARMAWEETGMGRPEDKEQKNLLVAEKTPGTEILTPVARSGDHGLVLMERAPYGVVGAITPSTNPTSSILCNGIGLVAAGNATVFNAHPAARRCSAETVALLNRAIVAAGGPPNLLCAPLRPTIESAQALMKHPDVRLLVITGGPGVVRVAMQSGKKAICAGPGNPPVVVDETADIEKAGQDIVQGASFDNNLVCVLEKEIIAVDAIADPLKEAMGRHGAVEIPSWQLNRLTKVILEEDRGPGRHGVVNKRLVGQDPHRILKEIGVSVPEATRLVVAEADRLHPLVWTEQLMPVIPLVRVKDADEAIDLAVQVEQGMGHTAVMHSRNIEKLSRMARCINCSIFVKNGPSLAGLGFGGEGYTSFSIASPTGEGLTTAWTFTRERRCTLVDAFRIV